MMQDERTSSPGNEQRQGVDKAPGEEQGKASPVTDADLKGKKVDRDPEDPADEPIERTSSK